MKAFCSIRSALLGHLRRQRIESLFAVNLAGDAQEFFPFVGLGEIDGERDALQLGMRLERHLQHDMNLFGLQRVGPGHFRRLPAKVCSCRRVPLSPRQS